VSVDALLQAFEEEALSEHGRAAHFLTYGSPRYRQLTASAC
jgi:hypothetical protein